MFSVFILLVSMVEHFLLVCYPMQSHINPLLQLARRLVHAGAYVTFSTAVSAHRLMFPESSSLNLPLDDPVHRRLSYFPYSDGYDDGYDKTKHSETDYFATSTIMSPRSLRSIASSPYTDDKPAITCIIYAIVISWAPKVAADLGLPAVLFWIQPSAVFSIYYHYFHGYKNLIDSKSTDDDLSYSLQLPGMSPISIRDLPSLIVSVKSEVDVRNNWIVDGFRDMFVQLDLERQRVYSSSSSSSFSGSVEKKRPMVLMNSFKALEPDVLFPFEDKFEFMTIGPLLPSPPTNGGVPRNIVKETTTTMAETKEYMEWLNQWPVKSVIYLSFGSMSILKKEQNMEVSRALRDIGRPYFWVVRGDREGVANVENGMGMVVSWCSQMEILSHNAVGCFVTHCGWNSMLEGIASGVPMIGFPQWSEQPTNVELMEGTWKNGIRAVVGEDGVLMSTELSRCLETVMGDGERGEKIRENAQNWKKMARLSLKEGGSSDLNLMSFVKDVGNG